MTWFNWKLDDTKLYVHKKTFSASVLYITHIAIDLLNANNMNLKLSLKSEDNETMETSAIKL